MPCEQPQNQGEKHFKQITDAGKERTHAGGARGLGGLVLLKWVFAHEVIFSKMQCATL